MPELLFIYGTLHPDRAPAAIATVARTLTLVSAATIRGTLVELGEYPGVVPGGGEVSGSLFALPEPADAAWSRLDAYEDFRPRDPESSLFVREKTMATLPDGTHVLCWVYLYNRAFRP
jgi:gamma-glutamylcyclotransferase (GGCT)/AIG2-like uncharacterized protein YtfP